jgi:hypothetical protein
MATTDDQGAEQLLALLEQARMLARDYYRLTDRPLGVTGEVAEAEAVRLLDVKLAPPRQNGYDATRIIDGQEQKVQVKGRVLQRKKVDSEGKVKPKQTDSAKIGTIRLNHEWDIVALVLMDDDFETTAIYEATRERIEAEIDRGGSKARKRGQLSVSAFKRLGRQTWPTGDLDNSSSLI